MKIVISKSDVVTAYGWGMDALWDGLLSGKTAITSSDRFADRGFLSNQMALVPGLQVAPGLSRLQAMLSRLLSPLIGKISPDTVVILATTVGEIEYLERAILEDKPALADEIQPTVLLSRIQKLLGLNKEGMVISSACASSTAAITRAASMVLNGQAAEVLVIACDSISEFVYAGFSSLLSLSDRPAKPFDANRNGLSLGEAAAWALVTRASSDDPELIGIVGWGSTSDAVHLTAPDRTAGGLSRAMDKALAMSGKKYSDVSFVAAHGTATIYSDAMELTAFQNTLKNPLPIFSIKGGMGHALGAAGLVQLLVAQRALQGGKLPPTVELETVDPKADGFAHITAVQLPRARFALSTNSGFGGVNTAVVLGNGKTSLAKSPAHFISVRAIGWFGNEQCGALATDANFHQAMSPSITDTDAICALIGRPVKNLLRMTAESRMSLTAAALTLNAVSWQHKQIGLLATGYQGCLHANRAYFQDYVTGGRSMSRGNLFIYTLPTSTLGEVAIALALNGPAFYVETEHNTLTATIATARQMIHDGEADAMLVIYSDTKAAVCIAIGDGDGEGINGIDWNQSPQEMARYLSSLVPQ